MTLTSDVLRRWQAEWRQDPKGFSLDLLRVGIGIIWALDLIFILDPANQYFPTFQMVAQTYTTQTLGGPAIADFVASHALLFAWLIAITTAYLAVAFLLGITTRLAAAVGIVFSAFFFVTQYTMTFMIPGGTDVGAHPLYILIYLVLFAGGAGNYLAADRLLWEGGSSFPTLAGWLCTPPPANVPAKGPTSTDEPAPHHSSSGNPRRAYAIWSGIALASIVALCLVAGIVGSLPQGGSPTAGTYVPTMVNVQNVLITIQYPGDGTDGGFGPSQQTGCWGCTFSTQPGTLGYEEEMLTNNHSSADLTVTSMHLGSPFNLTQSPSFPQVVRPGEMWMFNIAFDTPNTPGNYTVNVVFTVG